MTDLDEETALVIGGRIYEAAVVAMMAGGGKLPPPFELRNMAQGAMAAGQVFVEEATQRLELSRQAGLALEMLDQAGDCPDQEKQ